MNISEMSQVQHFIHCIDPTNWLACYNLKLDAHLSSPDIIALKDRALSSQHRSLRDVSLEELSQMPFPPGVVSPRVGRRVIPGAIIETGGHVGVGAQQTTWLSPDQESEVHKIWKVEIDFERRRRQIKPEAASRLCCLWLAEDNEQGRLHLRQMFGDGLSVLQVEISQQSRLSKADTAWFDRYFATGDVAFIDAYWRGAALNSNQPFWEYLLEGTIKVESTDIELLHSKAIQLSSWPEGLPKS